MQYAMAFLEPEAAEDLRRPLPEPIVANQAEPTVPQWIGTRPGIPCFFADSGRPWTPIGQN